MREFLSVRPSTSYPIFEPAEWCSQVIWLSRWLSPNGRWCLQSQRAPPTFHHSILQASPISPLLAETCKSESLAQYEIQAKLFLSTQNYNCLGAVYRCTARHCQYKLADYPGKDTRHGPTVIWSSDVRTTYFLWLDKQSRLFLIIVHPSTYQTSFQD